jgi:outer membrane protein
MVIALAVAFSSVAMAAEVKLGYVNLQRALNECSAGKEAVVELEAETKKRQEQVDIKQEELKKLNEEIEKKRAVWSEDMREQKQKELQAKMQEFQRFYLQSNDDNKKREQEKKTILITDLIELAKPLANEKGYTFIFEAQGLIYGPSDADLTNDLIKVYDDEYKKGKKDKK